LVYHCFLTSIQGSIKQLQKALDKEHAARVEAEERLAALENPNGDDGDDDKKSDDGT